MEKIITLTLLSLTLLVSPTPQAQTFTITGDFSISGDVNTSLNAYLNIENNTSQNLDVKCQKIVVDTVPGSANYFCFGDGCYTESVYLTYDTQPFHSGELRDSVFKGT